MRSVGKMVWTIADGYIPSQSTSLDRASVSHETACNRSAGPSEAHVGITVLSSDRNAIGPHHVGVPADRTLHVRFNDSSDRKPILRDTDYSSLFEPDVLVVIQHARLDSRKAELALLTTTAYGQD